MAKYKSLFNVEGTLGEVTFYKGEDGYFIRSKGGISKSRILKDPAFARTRENLTEFGNSAKSAKNLRRAVNSLMADAKDSKVTSRLTQIMSKIKNEDQTSARGQRNVATGIQTAQGKAWLKGFNFNKHAVMDSVLLASYSLDTATGEVTLSGLIPNQHINVPNGATHVSLSAAF